jgi:hypothetical protein
VIGSKADKLMQQILGILVEITSKVSVDTFGNLDPLIVNVREAAGNHRSRASFRLPQ